MGLLDKFKNVIRAEEARDDYMDEMDDEEMEQPVGTSSFATTNTPVTPQRSNKMKVIVIEPKEFEDSKIIAEHLLEMRPVVVNFENTDAHVAARIVDFISGSTFALKGNLQKVGKDIFICGPSNVTIDYTDHSYSELTAEALKWPKSEV